MVETRARVRCKQKRERESSHKSLTQSVLLTRPLSDDDAPVERHESRSNAPQLPPILEFSRFRRKRGALIVRHAADTFRTTTPLFSSFEQRASSPRCWSNVNKVFGACAVAGSFAANHTGLSAHATSIPQREYTISLFPSLFPLPFSLPRPSHPRDSRCRPPRARPCARARLAPHARLFFFLRRKEKRSSPATHPAVLRFEKLGRFYALRPRAIHAAVMATQRLWGSPRAKPPPCTMGKHDQYLNPPRYAFPLRDACLSLDDLLSLSLLLSVFRPVYTRFRVSSRIDDHSSLSPFLFFLSLSFVLLEIGTRSFSRQEEHDTDASLSSSSSSSSSI